MRTVGAILRWVGAVFAAALTFVIVYVVGALVWRSFGTNPVTTVDSQNFIAAFLAVSAGTYVVAREQRRTAALVLWILVCAGPLWFVLQDVVGNHFSLVDFAAFCSVLLGASTPMILARSRLLRGKRVNPVAGRTE
jgi:hypothetical protein